MAESDNKKKKNKGSSKKKTEAEVVKLENTTPAKKVEVKKSPEVKEPPKPEQEDSWNVVQAKKKV